MGTTEFIDLAFRTTFLCNWSVDRDGFTGTIHPLRSVDYRLENSVPSVRELIDLRPEILLGGNTNEGFHALAIVV